MDKGTAATKGCPDADGDGMVDADDECPNDAGPEASFYCPDKDGDLVPDYRDKCPEEKAPVEQMIERAVEAALRWATRGVEAAMNEFNQDKK